MLEADATVAAAADTIELRGDGRARADRHGDDKTPSPGTIRRQMGKKAPRRIVSRSRVADFSAALHNRSHSVEPIDVPKTQLLPLQMPRLALAGLRPLALLSFSRPIRLEARHGRELARRQAAAVSRRPDSGGMIDASR